MTFKKTTDLRQLAVVEVQWVDAASHGRWRVAEEVKDVIPAKSFTVGYLAEKTKECVKIVQNMNEFGHMADVIAIPAPWVTTIKILRKGKTL